MHQGILLCSELYLQAVWGIHAILVGWVKEGCWWHRQSRELCPLSRAGAWLPAWQTPAEPWSNSRPLAAPLLGGGAEEHWPCLGVLWLLW